MAGRKRPVGSKRSTPKREAALAGQLAEQGHPSTVRWQPGRPNLGELTRRGEQAWVCNQFLNAVFAVDAEPGILEPIRGSGEYNHLSVRSACAIILDRLRNDR